MTSHMRIEGFAELVRVCERIEARLGGVAPDEIDRTLLQEKVRSILEEHEPKEHVLARAAYQLAAEKVMSELETI
jgi:hypothetical protein